MRINGEEKSSQLADDRIAPTLDLQAWLNSVPDTGAAHNQSKPGIKRSSNAPADAVAIVDVARSNETASWVSYLDPPFEGMANYAAGKVAAEVQNILQSSRRDSVERKEAEQTVRESQMLFQATLDTIASPICILNEKGDIIAANLGWLKLWEQSGIVSPDSSAHKTKTADGLFLLGNYLDFYGQKINPESSDISGAIQAILSGASESFAEEYPCSSPIGEQRMVCRITRLYSGGSLRVVVEYNKISDRAEEKVKEHEGQSQLFFDHVPAALATFDNQMRYLQVSRRWLANFGLEGRDVIGMSHYDIFPQISERWKEAHRLALAGEVVKSDEDVFQLADGTRQWLKWEIRPWRDFRGQVGGIMICSEDITERKQFAEAMRVSEERLRLAQESAEIGTFDTNTQTGVQTWSTRLLEMFGLSPDALPPGVDDLMKIIHPEDHQKAIQFYASLASGNRARVQYRISPRPGETRWIECFGQGIRNDDGVPARYIGVGWDVTDRTCAEENHRRSSAELRALTSRLQTAAENDRRRIARDLHDELGQALTGLKMDLDWIIRKHSAGEAPWIEMVIHAMKVVDSTVEAVQNLSRELRPTMIDALGLPAAIEWYASEFERRSGISCAVCLPKEPVEFPAHESISVFRIVQEALTNVARHSHAKSASVKLERSCNAAVLVVHDDGIGFPVGQTEGPQSLGLLGMRERALDLGADLSIDSVPGHGTSVTLRIPLEVEPECGSDAR